MPAAPPYHPRAHPHPHHHHNPPAHPHHRHPPLPARPRPPIIILPHPPHTRPLTSIPVHSHPSISRPLQSTTPISTSHTQHTSISTTHTQHTPVSSRLHSPIFTHKHTHISRPYTLAPITHSRPPCVDNRPYPPTSRPLPISRPNPPIPISCPIPPTIVSRPYPPIFYPRPPTTISRPQPPISCLHPQPPTSVSTHTRTTTHLHNSTHSHTSTHFHTPTHSHPHPPVVRRLPPTHARPRPPNLCCARARTSFYDFEGVGVGVGVGVGLKWSYNGAYVAPLKRLSSTFQLDCYKAAVAGLLGEYVARLSEVAGSLITCGPVLNWLELDNRGHRLIVTDDSDINTPAVAAAYVVKRYIAQASDEISFERPRRLAQAGWLSLKDMLGKSGRVCSSSLVYYVVYPLA
ncbi:hypothetical protein Pcinc_041236 [Petrolisthes cinctipes]|uniref:Uncharacterized protein n=1 Tax=Petrolisthes cinctipes TaxID=88211 RepID=A0AAE1EIL9_PETCI|nr:hypothetical protein Pcinc_041236 [Petrolisthes cinctipes]